jgi:hypothetical protein
MENTKRYLKGILLFACGVISIGISSWQFQNDDNGVSWGVNWTDYCNSYPQTMLRRKLKVKLCFCF